MMSKSMEKYYKKHPMMLMKISALAGVGVGMLLARPLAGEHPVRWGVAFIAAALILKMSAMSK